MKFTLVSILIFVFLQAGCNKNTNENTNENKSSKKDTTIKDSDLTQYKSITIEGVGEILLSSKMEVQSGKYKEQNETYYKKLGTTYPDFVIQQKGLNDFEDEAKSTYARIIIKTMLLEKNNRVGRLYENIDLTQEDLIEMEEELKRSITSDLKKIDNELLEWNNLRFVNVNIYPAISSNYIRKFKNNPSVKVTTYFFFNYDRTHRITFSYRVEDEDQWMSVFKKVKDNIVLFDAFKE
jgi:hypothetical protein